jgi:SUF system FeS cluster assembly, SufBD/BspA type Leucine rich repeat region (6 copies)/Bacterial regulatory proteins, lacI family
VTNIAIPVGVTAIGRRVFENCSSLITVTVPIGVTSVGDWAFRDCISLSNIEIPPSVIRLGDGVFHGCRSLTQIAIPQGVPECLSPALSSLRRTSLGAIAAAAGVSAMTVSRALRNAESTTSGALSWARPAAGAVGETVQSRVGRQGQHARRTDAFQKVRNLILSPEAEANSLPGLEILADEVRCSHGATTGEINADELFYMQARGIPAREAYRLITFGFLNEALERFPDAGVRARLQEALEARLQGH